jgi:hypothetical protein
MLSVLLALHLAAVDGRGEYPPELDVTVREQTRVQASVHFAGVFALGAAAWGGGPGVSGTVGAMVSDRFAVMARASLGTTVFLIALTAGVAAEYALSDRWSLGLGLAFGYHGGTTLDMPTAWSVLAPLRLGFSPSARHPQQISRHGLQLFLEAAPGVAPYSPSSSGGFGILPKPEPVSPFVFMASVGVGYAWW